MGEVPVNVECEIEAAAFIHALVRLDSECKVEDIVRVWKIRFHGAAEGALEFCEV